MPKLKRNISPTKILSGHLHLGSKLLAKFHEPNSSGSLDILLTRFSLAKYEMGHYSTMKTDRKDKTNLQWAITREVSGSIYSNVNQVIYFSLTICSLGFKALASKVFEILC